MKETSPEPTRLGSRHQKPMSAYDIAPMTSQPISRTTRSVAVTVTSIAPVNTSISPKKRVRDSSGENSPAENTRMARLTDVTVRTSAADSPSTAKPAGSRPKSGKVTTGRATAAAIARPSATNAAVTAMAGAALSVRRPSVKRPVSSSTPVAIGTAGKSQARALIL